MIVFIVVIVEDEFLSNLVRSVFSDALLPLLKLHVVIRLHTSDVSMFILPKKRKRGKRQKKTEHYTHLGLPDLANN